MKTKPLEVGDRVSVKYVTDIHGNNATVYLDGKLVEEHEKGGMWLVEYTLGNAISSIQYKDWWLEDDITSKHVIGPTDEERFQKAEKIKASEWTGPVYYDDKYYHSIEDLDYPYPEFVWAVKVTPVKLKLNLFDYVAEALDDQGYEEMYQNSRYEELFTRLNAIQREFVSAASNETVWDYTYKKAIILGD